MRHITVADEKQRIIHNDSITSKYFFMKGKYVDTQILLACLSGGKKRSKKMAA